MSIKNRLVKLETDRGVNKVNKYLCVISPEGMGSPEEKALGYKVQPLDGTGGEPSYIATRAELDAFGARPDIELTIVSIGYTDTPTKEE